MSEISFTTFIQEAIAAGVADLRVSMPGVIKSFDATSQTASVEVSTGEFPIISAVPVVFEGAGGFAITFPVAAGDPCLLIFQDKSIDEWAAGQSGAKKTKAPSDPRTHSLMDCVAVLGARNDASKLTQFDTDRMVVGNKGPRIGLDGSAVHLGVDHEAQASQDVLRGTAHLQALKDYLDSILTALNTLLGTGATSTGAVTFAGLPAYTPAIEAAKAAFNAAQHLTPKVKVP